MTHVTHALSSGNVTAFSRVQKFLESHKVINEGGVSKDDFQRIKRRLKSHKKDVSRQKKSFAENQMKKLRLDDNKTTPDDRGDADVKLSSRTRPNPFKLVPLETYDGQQQVCRRLSSVSSLTHSFSRPSRSACRWKRWP